MRALAGLLLGALALGCTHQERIVQVPIPVPCQRPAKPARPDLGLDFPETATDPEIIRGLEIAVEALKGHVRELEKLGWPEQ